MGAGHVWKTLPFQFCCFKDILPLNNLKKKKVFEKPVGSLALGMVPTELWLLPMLCELVMVCFLSLLPVTMKLFSENVGRYWRVKYGEMGISRCPAGRQFRTGDCCLGRSALWTFQQTGLKRAVLSQRVEPTHLTWNEFFLGLVQDTPWASAEGSCQGFLLFPSLSLAWSSTGGGRRLDGGVVGMDCVGQPSPQHLLSEPLRQALWEWLAFRHHGMA